MTFFFDRNLGITIPRSLSLLDPPIDIRYHQEFFPNDKPDDEWLSIIGAWDWIVIAQDYKFHLLPNELFAIRQYNIGIFYLWGAKAKKWDIARVFMRAYDRVVDVATSTTKPFVFWVGRDARLRNQPLP